MNNNSLFKNNTYFPSKPNIIYSGDGLLFGQQPSQNLFQPAVTNFDIDKQLKLISEQLKEIKNSQTNIYFNSTEKKQKTQASTLPRKPVNSSKFVPTYVTVGNVSCNQCSLEELIYGYHYDNGGDTDSCTDLCTECFNKFSYTLNKEEWIQFSI